MDQEENNSSFCFKFFFFLSVFVLLILSIKNLSLPSKFSFPLVFFVFSFLWVISPRDCHLLKIYRFLIVETLFSFTGQHPILIGRFVALCDIVWENLSKCLYLGLFEFGLSPKIVLTDLILDCFFVECKHLSTLTSFPNIAVERLFFFNCFALWQTWLCCFKLLWSD